MIESVGKLFSLRREEMAPATLLFFYLFLVLGAFLMGQAVGDALFLDAFPTQLPKAMIGSALMIFAVVAVYIRLSARLRLETLVTSTLMFFALSFACFWWLAGIGLYSIYFPVYIWVYAAGAMGPMMGWTLANYILTTREARRIFGFIGAGAILGGTFLSFITSDLLHRGHVRPHNLLLAISLLLVVCAVLIRLLFRSARHRLAAVSTAPAAGQGTPKGIAQSLRLVHDSRYLRLLAVLTAVGCLATCILGYQFKVIAKAAYGADKVGLAAFFSRFYGYMGLASFIFQLALTGPLLRIFGIRVTVFVVPATLMGASIGVLATPSLLMGSILRACHYLLRYSLDKSSIELLYLPVSAEIKSQVKSFIDTFISRSADGVAGLILLFFTSVLKFNPGLVSAVNLVCLSAWLAVAYAVRREYLNVLRQAIEHRTLDPERTAAQVLDSTTTEVIAEALERGGEQQLLYGMSLLEMERRTVLHPVLRGLLNHRSPSVRESALRLLGDAGDLEVLPRAEELLGDESLEVRAEALRYLSVHAGRDPLTLLTRDTNLPVHVVQGAIGAYFARHTGEGDSSAAIELILDNLLSLAGPAEVPARREAARLLGVIPPPSDLHSRLHELLNDSEPEVVEQALLSAGKTRRGELVPAVVARLGQPRLAPAARAALVMYGRSEVGTLRSYLNDAAVPLAVRRQIPATLALLPIAESAAALAHSLVQVDPGLRFDVLKALNKLRDRNPDLLPADVDYADMVNFELIGYCRSIQILNALKSPGGKSGYGSERLLVRALRERMAHERERIFRLLALIYPPRDIHNAFVSLSSDRPRLQANAMEVLENLVQPELYRPLANVLDPEVDRDRRVLFANQFCRTVVNSPAEALRILLYSEDVWLCACALYMAGGLRLLELSADLAKIAHKGDPLLTETWNWAQARLAAEAPI